MSLPYHRFAVLAVAESCMWPLAWPRVRPSPLQAKLRARALKSSYACVFVVVCVSLAAQKEVKPL